MSQYTQQSIGAWDGLNVPELHELDLDLLVQQGILTPEQAQAAQQDPSVMAQIQTDPTLMQAQYDALQSLQDISSNGGLTASDRAQLNQISTEEAAKARGAREAILQNAEARGAGGSGMSILAQLQNAQDSATRQSQRDLDVAGMAQQRALQALQAAGTQANQMQQTSFGQQAEKAKSQDAINQFNTANMQQANLTNTAATNDARKTNLAVKQDVANQNVGIKNQEQVANKVTIPQANYDNQYKATAGKAATLADAGKTENQQGQHEDDLIMKLVGTGIAAMGAASDERVKEDIEPFSASDFLDSITGYKYRYKEPEKHGGGDRFGPMAQDLEKSEMGASLVEDTPEGKMVDTKKASMAALMALGEINERLKKLEGEE